MARRGQGRASLVAQGIASGSKAYVRHAGKVSGRSDGTAPGKKQYARGFLGKYSIRQWDDFLRLYAIGTLAQVCTGASRLGLIRIDIDPASPGANVRASAFALPLRDGSVDTVACDPIYGIGYPERIHLQHELARVARRRILMKAPWIPRARGWRLTQTFLLASHTCANVSVLSVLARRGEPVELGVAAS